MMSLNYDSEVQRHFKGFFIIFLNPALGCLSSFSIHISFSTFILSNM